jgi:hypothetical protein
MSLVVVVGLGAIAWAVLCALVVAVCVSAKEGDGTFSVHDGVGRRRRRAHGSPQRTIPSVR